MVNNLVFTRIDDRLIHGQVVAAWLHAYSNIQHIIVIDDKTSEDSFMKEMFSLLVPTGITIEILNVAKAIEKFKSGLDKPTMVIVKVPLTIKQLVDGGVPIDYVNIGGMGMSGKRKQFHKNISMDEDEKAIFRELIQEGVHVDIQIIPAYNKVDLSKLL